MSKVRESRCRWCGASIVWVKNVATGKVAPLDWEPSERGNCYWDELTDTYTVLPTLVRQQPEYAGVLRTNHWSTCTHADEVKVEYAKRTR